MTVIAEYTVPASEFVLGRAAVPQTSLELERMVGLRGAAIPIFWARGDGVEQLERSLREQDVVEDLQTLDGLDGMKLYRGHFDPKSDCLTRAFIDHEVRLLSGEGSTEQWSFELRFPDARTLSEFQSYCLDVTEAGMELTRLYNPVDGAAPRRSDLTDRQRETLVAAYRQGYFDIPRRITLVDLAEELGVSDQAVSERMRRGEAKLVGTHLVDEE